MFTKNKLNTYEKYLILLIVFFFLQTVSAQPTFNCDSIAVFKAYNYDLLNYKKYLRAYTSPLCPNGTILFKEDFGGNDPNDPVSPPVGIPQVVGYSYGGGGLLQLPGVEGVDPRMPGNYAIRKYGYPHGQFWVRMDDHTYPNDKTRGYMLQVDGGTNPGQFYSVRLDNLCANTNLYFSIWAANVYNTGEKPNLTFLIEDQSGNELLRENTGDIPYASNENDWHQYGASFVMPEGQTSATFRIIHNGLTYMGNDFVLDDIEIRLCTPPVTLQLVDSVCMGDRIEITSIFNNDGTFQEPLAYRWLKSTTGSLIDQSSWQTISTNNDKLTIPIAAKADEGYYRLAIGSITSIDQEYCRAMSDPVFEEVKEDCVASCNDVQTNLTATICQNESYTDNGFNLLNQTTAGVFIHQLNLQTTQGCDSTVVLTLTVNSIKQRTLNEEIFVNHSYVGNGFNLPVQTTVGDFVFTLHRITYLGCDSIVTLNLNVKELPLPCNNVQTNLSDAICENQSYNNYGFNLPAQKISGEFIHELRLQTTTGCDSIVTLLLTVNNSFKEKKEVFLTEGESILVDGYWFSELGEDEYIHSTIAGCDSIITYSIKEQKDLTDDNDNYNYSDCDPIIPDQWFSPNDDAVHDFWLIENIDCYDYQIEIYDRYGKLLRRWENNFNGWDGTYNGNPVISDDYWYRIRLKGSGQKDYIGHFNLRR